MLASFVSHASDNVHLNYFFYRVTATYLLPGSDVLQTDADSFYISQDMSGRLQLLEFGQTPEEQDRRASGEGYATAYRRNNRMGTYVVKKGKAVLFQSWDKSMSTVYNVHGSAYNNASAPGLVIFPYGTAHMTGTDTVINNRPALKFVRHYNGAESRYDKRSYDTEEYVDAQTMMPVLVRVTYLGEGVLQTREWWMYMYGATTSE